MKKKFGFWALCALFLVSGFAQAQDCGERESFEMESVPYTPFRVEYGAPTHTAFLNGGWRHVRELRFLAHAVWSSGGTVEVIVNGGLKRVVNVSPVSQEYVVPVEETVRSVDFHYAGGDYVDVTDARVLVGHRIVDDFCSHDYQSEPTQDFRSSLPSKNLASYLANRAIHNVDKLIPYADPETEYVPYLLPIKTVAGRAVATATAEGDLSINTRTAMKAVSAQIVFAEPVITALMKKPVSFDMAVELLSIKHEIDDRLH